MDSKFKGVFPALLTPFKADGSINDDSVAKLIEYNVRKGVDGFYVGGSTGEGMLLTVDERKQLFRASAEANAGRTTMIAHVGTICTDHARRKASIRPPAHEKKSCRPFPQKPPARKSLRKTPKYPPAFFRPSSLP